LASFAPNRTMKIAAPDFVRDLDLTDEELCALLDLAADMKRSPAAYAHRLAGKSIALLFEKPSLRTRLTFELAIRQLGGSSVFVEGLIGGREPLKDVGRNLDRWVNGIVARVFTHDTVEQLAHWSAVPVVNALSDIYHPCQALADMQTFREQFGNGRGRTLAFVGDGNNVVQSLLLTATRLGVSVRVGTPPGYEPSAEILAQAEGLAAVTGCTAMATNDPVEAVRGADAVYTDVWTSMGQENEAARRRKDFLEYQVNEELLAHANPGAVFMHCLPAKRDEEVTDAVIECPRSVVFDQAENRLHTQKALLAMLL
jgi:ornithine carbamoyltransferase